LVAMKVNFTRAQFIQAIVIITALAFILSTLATWYSGAVHKNVPATTPSSDGTLSEENVTMGTAKVALIIDSYSPVIRVSGLSSQAREYLQQLQQNGTILYIDTSNPSYETIALSKGDYTYEVASNILALGPNVTMLLEAYVYSDGEVKFQTQNGIVNATIPKSRITVARPYPNGERLFFNALVQLMNGKVVGAKLTPLAVQEMVQLPVEVNAFYNKYHARLYFNWHDRVGVENEIARLNESLNTLGARNITLNYIRDDTVYANRTLKSGESAALHVLLPGLKVVQLNKIVFYSNYSYTEDEVGSAVANVTNGTASLSFSPPLLMITFDFDGNESDAVAALTLPYTPISSDVYRLSNATTGGVNVNVKGKSYDVDSMELNVWVPVGTALNRLAFADFEVSIVGDRIIEAKQVIPPKYQ